MVLAEHITGGFGDPVFNAQSVFRSVMDAMALLNVSVEPTAPPEIADLRARAHGLSARERDVALGLARGESTEAMAARLCVSTHTVRDHLKAVFRKTGTTSRTEVVSHLFSTWYADRVFGPQG